MCHQPTILVQPQESLAATPMAASRCGTTLGSTWWAEGGALW
jgi:hypothetical protein